MRRRASNAARPRRAAPGRSLNAVAERALPIPTAVGLAVSLGGVALLASPAHRLLGDPALLRTRWIDQAILWLLFATVLAIVRHWERRPFASIGLRRHLLRSAAVAGALTACVVWVATPLAIALVAAVGLPAIDASIADFGALPFSLKAVSVVTAGVVEETLFRGYALERLAPVLGGVWRAALVTHVAFALVHGAVWGAGGVLLVFCTAIPFTLAYLWQRDLVANVLAHVAVDGVGLLLPSILAAL